MTVCASVGEETQPTPPAARSSRANAFRVLSVYADAPVSLIEKQRARKLIEIELRPGRVEGAFGLKGLTKQEVLEAGHRLEPETRLLEELFWVHGMECDPDAEPMVILDAVRSQAAGPLATHNLAVLQTIRGQESEPSAWEEALTAWKSTLNEPLFWDFMKERVQRIGARNGHAAKLKAEVSDQLSKALKAQLKFAGKQRDIKAVTVLAKSASCHREWLQVETDLRSVGEQITREGFVSLGAVLDRVGERQPGDNQAATRLALLAGEKELGCIATAYGGLIRALGDMASGEGWDPAVCSSYQRLSIASLRLLGEFEQAGRLMEEARKFASEAQLTQIQREWGRMRWQMLHREATTMLQVGNYVAAEQKLTEAQAFSTPEQKQQEDDLRETIGFARAAEERQRRLQQNNRVCSDAVDERASPSAFLTRALWLIAAAVLVIALAVVLGRGSQPKEAVIVAPVQRENPVPSPSKPELGPERTAILTLAQSLAERHKSLERETAALEKQRASLEAVAFAYQREVVPQAGKALYDALLQDYNSKKEQHESKLVAWRADAAAYQARVHALDLQEEALR